MAEGNEVIDNAGTSAPDGGNNGEAKDKVEFSPEQQAKVQKLIDDAYTKSGRKFQSELDGVKTANAEQLDAMRAELEVAKNKKPTSTEGIEESKKVIDDLNAQLVAKGLEFEAKNESIRNEKKVNALFGAVGKQDVLEPQDVVALLKDRIGADDDGNIFVKGEGGSPKLNQHGEAQNVDEFVQEWLSARPHMLRGSNGGAGSQGGHGGNGSVKHNLTDPEVWRNLSEEDFKRYMDEGVVVHQAKGAALSFKNTTNKFRDARKKQYKAKE